MSGSFASSLNAGRGWRQNSCISPAKKPLCDGSNAVCSTASLGRSTERLPTPWTTVPYSTLVPFQRWRVLCVVSRKDTIRMNLSVLVRFIMFRIITRSVVGRGRTGATDSARQSAGATDSGSSRQCWWSTKLSLAVDHACVMVVQCPRLFRKPLSLGAPVAEPAKAAPFCKACWNVERLGNQNDQAHLRVWPCTWVRKAPAPRKKAGG